MTEEERMTNDLDQGGRASVDEMGPIDYLVVEFPGSKMTGEGFPLLLDLAAFEGASSGLLGEDDIHEAGNVLEPGSSAGILVYENVWAGPFASALRRGGGQLVASGRIPVQALLAALDAVETADTST